MTLDDFCAAGWTEHATDAAAVMARLPEGVALTESGADLAKLAGLITHVAGEHLGRWAEGLALLEALRARRAFDAMSADGKSMLRSLAALHACAGDEVGAERLTREGLSGGDVPEASDRGRVAALVATSLAGQGRIADAARALDAALRHAAYGPGPKDPLARMLAVSGNNLAVEFESRETLTDDERALMLRAAETAREFWGIAGGWMETERAEYRLAMSCLKAAQPERAKLHAQECLRIVKDNGSDVGELFFAHEALALAHLAQGDGAAAEASTREAREALAAISDAGFRDYCAEELSKLEAKFALRAPQVFSAKIR